MPGWRWKLVLPLGNLAIAASLLAYGEQQKQAYLAANDALAAWDYLAPATQISYMINFPAFGTSSLIGHLSRLGPGNRTAVFLACVALMWLVVGLRVDRRRQAVVPEQGPRRVVLAARTAALVAVAALGVFALALLKLHPLVGLAGLFWAAVLFRQFWKGLATAK